MFLRFGKCYVLRPYISHLKTTCSCIKFTCIKTNVAFLQQVNTFNYLRMADALTLHDLTNTCYQAMERGEMTGTVFYRSQQSI